MRHQHPREEIARVGRKDVGMSDESVLMSVSWNAGFITHGGGVELIRLSSLLWYPWFDQQCQCIGSMGISTYFLIVWSSLADIHF